MKKLFLILLSVLLSIGAWAETAVLATSTMDGQAIEYVGPAGKSSTNNNVMVGKVGGIGAGWVLQCNKLDKGCNGSQTMTIDGTEYTSLKNSNGIKHTVKVPDGYVATSVTFYAVSNYTYDATTKTAKLSEFNGETCADEVANKGATPTAITKLLGYATSFTFTFSVTQVNYLIVVTYQEALPEYTFGIGRNVETAYTETEGNILAAGQEQLKGTAPTGVVVTQTTTCDYANADATMYHGATDNANKYTATNAWRNMLNNVAVNAAYNEGFYAGFSVSIPEGKRMNVLEIFGDFVAQKNNFAYKFEVFKNGEKLFEGEHATANITNCGSDKVAMTANTRTKEALRGLAGTVEFRMPWWIASDAASGAVLDFNIKAVFEDVTLTGKEYTLKGIKINDLTYDYITNGNTVLESYATLPSVKFIYSVKKVWSDGVKTDAEDEEEVVTPVLDNSNQVATTTKLAEPYTLTFTNIAQFPAVPNAVGTYIDLSQATGTSFNIENNGANIGSTKANTVMNLDLINTTAGNYLLQFLSGASGLTATIRVDIIGADNYSQTQNFNIANTGAWTLSEFHAMELKNLPAGNLTLKLTVTSTTATYAGNYGNFAIYALSSYNQCNGTNFDLTKGTYTGGARYEVTNQNVGYVVNGASAEYTMYNATEGVATLHMGLLRYNDGTVTVTVKDMLTGTTELTTSFVTTTDVCKGYNTPSDIQLGQLTTGPKSIRFDFAIESNNFICNYKNVNVTIQLPTPAHATISDQMTAEAMAALNGFTGDVTVNRSLTAGMFNTICLPFAMTAAEISAKLGTCDIRELSTSTLNDNELVLTFATATTIEAGKAYLINPTAAVSGWTMENVTLSTTATSTVATSADFIGVLTPTELAASENTLCVGARNTLFYVNSTSTMKGLRAYFQVKGAAVGAPARISLGGQVATGVENVNDNANVSKLIEQGRVIIRIDGHDYDLNGRMIR